MPISKKKGVLQKNQNFYFFAYVEMFLIQEQRKKNFFLLCILGYLFSKRVFTNADDPRLFKIIGKALRLDEKK